MLVSTPRRTGALRRLIRALLDRLADRLDEPCVCTDDEVTCWRHYHGR